MWVLSLGWEDTLEKNGYPSQWSCLDSPMDRRASPWVTKSWTQLRDLHFHSTSVEIGREVQSLSYATHTHTHTSEQRSINDIPNSHLELKFTLIVMLTHHVFCYTVEKTRGHTRSSDSDALC